MTTRPSTPSVLRHLLVASTLLAAAGAAHAAPIYEYALGEDDTAINQNAAGGRITSIVTTYDTNTEEFSWSYTTTDNNDGFWLVVSPYDNPKDSDGELAILYGDTANSRLTAYRYNGRNNNQSYSDPGVLLGAFEGALVTTPGAGGTQTVSFSIDATDINAALPDVDSTGVAFGEHIGVWFHPVAGSNFSYGAPTNPGDARPITGFTTSSAGWVDNRRQLTRQVPEPALLYLVAIGLFAFSASRVTTARRGSRFASHRSHGTNAAFAG